MKITFVLPNATLCGGVRVVGIYAQQLAARGHEVTLVSTPVRIPGPREALRKVVKERRWPFPPRAPESFLDGLDVNLRMLDRFRPVTDADVDDGDIIVATWWETAEWVAELSAAKGEKVYFIQGDEAALYDYPGDPKRQRARATWLQPMRRVTVARWLAELIEDVTGEAPDVVPNGVDTRRFFAAVRGRQPVPTVGMMYSPARVKGSDLSIAAAVEARRKIPNLRLIAFGEHAPTPEVPLPAWAEFHRAPAQARIAEIYASCDAWLFGSRREGFGLPILEAMACRTPVIAMPVGAAPELLARGGGMLVGAEDPGSMAAAIGQLMEAGETAWRTMSDAARATAESCDWDRSVDRFECILQEAVSERQRDALLGAAMR